MNLEIYLSDRCNFGCPYCCVSTNAGPAARLSVERVEKGIDRFLALPVPASFPERQIYFLGGEPLLDFPAIRRAVRYIRGRDRGIGIRVYTNGSLLTRAIVDFLGAHGVQVWVSLDGAKETNDRHRTVFGRPAASAYEAVFKRVREVGPANIALNVVVHPDTATSLASDVATFEAMGVRRINIQPELYVPYSLPQRRRLALSLSNLRRYYAAFVRRRRRLPFVLPILYAVIQSFSRVGEDVTPWWHDCENVVLGADGNFYACERVLAARYDDPALERFIIGDAETGVDLAKKERWMERARSFLYARGEKSREHYHCPKGDFLYNELRGTDPAPLLESAHQVSRVFCRAFRSLVKDLEHDPVFRAVYIDKREGGAADEGRPERRLYPAAVVKESGLPG